MNPMEDELVLKAKKFAFEKHKDQMYDEKLNLPMMYHLEMVVQRAVLWGHIQPVLIAGCYLHDTLEDTDTTYEEIKEQFGYPVASTVFDVTDEEGDNRFERWCLTAPKIRSSATSTLVKLCDRHSNMLQSLNTKHKHLGMYVKEYPVFKASLYDPWRFKKEWTDLDSLYKIMKDQK